MEVTVDRRPGSLVAMTVTVEPSVVENQVEKLFQQRARRVTVPGFRPGKAPRHMLERYIDRSALLQYAIEDVIDATYKDALRQENLEPLEQGEIEEVKPGDDLSLTYTVLVSVRPEIDLPPYTNLEVHYTPTVITDEQVDAEIERLRDMSAEFTEVTEEGIAQGDYVTIDYTMTVNGEPYPEGEVTGYPLEVGSDTFFPELNEGLLGVKQGETTNISTNYPDDYSNEDLAGKTAEFEITVQQVRRHGKPEVNDAWVETISQGSLHTVDELRERIHHNLQVVAADSDRDHIRAELIKQVVSGASLEVPDTLADEQFEHQMEDLRHRLAHQRMTMEEYAEAVGRTEDDIRQEQRVVARDMVRRSLVLQEVARREDITVTEADVDTALSSASAGEGRSVAELRRELEAADQLEHLRSRIFQEKILSFLESRADIHAEGVETPEEKADEETPAEATTEATEEQNE